MSKRLTYNEFLQANLDKTEDKNLANFAVYFWQEVERLGMMGQPMLNPMLFKTAKSAKSKLQIEETVKSASLFDLEDNWKVVAHWDEINKGYQVALVKKVWLFETDN